MKKIDYLTFLQQEIEELTSRFRPEDTGHIRTAVSVLKDRAEEVKNELRDLENMLGKGDLA
tara:strand:- start:82 stop:264 length:183 start_codon:yes stop_codon:yes gene_type:complete